MEAFIVLFIHSLVSNISVWHCLGYLNFGNLDIGEEAFGDSLREGRRWTVIVLLVRKLERIVRN